LNSANPTVERTETAKSAVPATHLRTLSAEETMLRIFQAHDKGLWILAIVCIGVLGCEEETSWLPHMVSLSYFQNRTAMPNITESDSLNVEKGDKLAFRAFTYRLFPTTVYKLPGGKDGGYTVRVKDVPPVPDVPITSEMRVVITPPSGPSFLAESFDERNSIATAWVRMEHDAWRVPGPREALVINDRWKYLKIQAQVRRKGSVINVRPEIYIRLL
jgi:hypothetical protein